MKSDPSKNLISKLKRISGDLEDFANPESKAAFLKNLDYLIAALSRLRSGLLNPSFEERTADIQKSIEQVIEFLESAKSDELIRTLLSRTQKVSKPKRQPIEIPNNLTNEQIRSLLQKDLSKGELKAIATQRSISVGKLNNEGIKRDILRNIDRQEGYERLVKN